jgi:hypothetical protein
MNNTDGDRYTDIPNNIYNGNPTTDCVQVPINTIDGDVLPSDIGKKPSEENRELSLRKRREIIKIKYILLRCNTHKTSYS